ncbi:MAG: aminotransferase class I/II-fold pyridoxal phosphate-dependent enzyme [Desulfobacteraceae bacterium]|nr:aminotransferase class I/II-fold pyridoxal phosphate-dependent enzyme [Desulfobacteraceae bacterium]
MIHGHGGNIYALALKLGCRPEEIMDVSSNINPLGPPPGLMVYLKDHLPSICALPEVDSKTAVTQMASLLNLDPESLLAGAGTTQFIYAMFAALRSRKVLIVGPTYADYADACRMQHLEPNYYTAEKDQCFEPDMAALTQQAGDYDTVIICNPNNPTGVLIPRSSLLNLCRCHPDTRFVIDESYLPFVPEAETLSMAGCGLANVLVLHSLSKIYRLPGLRIGFLIASPGLIECFRGLLLPWGLNSLAQAAVQFLYFHRDSVERFVWETLSCIAAERFRLLMRIEQLNGWIPFPSVTSFFLIQLPAHWTARQLSERFALDRILVRDCGNFLGLGDRFIRIAVNKPNINDLIVERLSAYVADFRAHP